MSAHARLSASGAARWMRCPGSVDLEATLPDPGSAYAEEGTQAHALAEACLRTDRDAQQIEGDWPAAMREPVQRYVDYVRTLQPAGATRYVEQRVDFGAWVPGGFGTADALISAPGTLHVVDLKFGAGVPVDATDNPQTRLYALGAYHALGWLETIDVIEMHIVQPRRDHISVERLATQDLLTWGDAISQAAQRTLSPNPPLIPGETQCRFCRAAAVCAARAEANQAIARDDFAEPRPAPKTLSLEQIADLLPRLDELKRWADDVQQYALRQALDGQAVPGHKLVAGRSIRQWRDEAETIKALRKLKYAEGDYLTKKLAGVPAIEKLLGGKAKAAPVLEHLVHKPEGKPALVLEADKRPALQTAASAKGDFSQAA